MLPFTPPPGAFEDSEPHNQIKTPLKRAAPGLIAQGTPSGRAPQDEPRGAPEPIAGPSTHLHRARAPSGPAPGCRLSAGSRRPRPPCRGGCRRPAGRTPAASGRAAARAAPPPPWRLPPAAAALPFGRRRFGTAVIKQR